MMRAIDVCRRAVLVVLLGGLAQACFAQSATPERAPASARRVAEQVCAACHGITGQSTQAEYPSLAGQGEAYLFKQLSQFKDSGDKPALRRNPVMRALVQDMSEEQMRDLARYFSRQPPARGRATRPDLVEAGRSVYLQGNPSGRLPACVTCHRAGGEGIVPDFPRIAGQQPEYVVRQLQAWKDGARGGPGKLMSLLVPLMSDAEIEAVAQYVAQLR